MIVLTKKNAVRIQAISDLLTDDADVINKEPQEDLEIRDINDVTSKNGEPSHDWRYQVIA